MHGCVLIVDDDPRVREPLRRSFSGEPVEIVEAHTGEEALRLFRECDPRVVIVDTVLPDQPGLEVLRGLKSAGCEVPVVMVAAESDGEDLPLCMESGAVDYVRKPLDELRLITAVRNAVNQSTLRHRVAAMARELREGDSLASLVGSSGRFEQVRELLRHAATSEMPVLLLGELGTGKEVTARALHAERRGLHGPFFVLRCRAHGEACTAALFGTAGDPGPGSEGLVELADGGTLYLEEVGALPLEAQKRLLDLLQDGGFHRVGSGVRRTSDVRVVASSSRSLEDLVAQGRFRTDLFRRLGVFPVHLPPLRERGEDVVKLARAFLDRHAPGMVKRFTEPALEALRAYRWPGNLDELERAVERAALVSRGEEIGPGCLPEEVQGGVASGEESAPGEDGGPGVRPGEGHGVIVPFVEEERRLILRALQITGWNVQEAANRLKIGRATIYRKIDRYNLRPYREAARAGSLSAAGSA